MPTIIVCAVALPTSVAFFCIGAYFRYSDRQHQLQTLDSIAPCSLKFTDKTEISYRDSSSEEGQERKLRTSVQDVEESATG